MIRTQIYLTEEECRSLRGLSRRTGRRQSALVREAVDQYVARHDKTHKQAAIDQAFGLWKDRTDFPDFADLRRGWARRSLRLFKK